MDAIRAKRMFEELRGKPVANWQVTGFLGAGKSALVLKVEDSDHRPYALKIFDPELVEAQGFDVQLERVNRELKLRGVHHKNIVEIIDGGQCDKSKYLFVVMEIVDWPTLDKVLADVPQENIWDLVGGLAEGARFLEEREIAHRDIKPSNIAVSPDYKDIKLLDLGVIRPFSAAKITDDEGKKFIGTLQYSSPEFLLREEKQNIDGWRALSFYQIGAVIYELITRRILFLDESEPYARLVQAILSKQPDFSKVVVSDPYLISLARTCLIKQPEKRLELLTWLSFSRPSSKKVTIADLKQGIRQRSVVAAADSGIFSDVDEERERRRREIKFSEMIGRFSGTIRGVFIKSDIFPAAIFPLKDDAIEGFATQFVCMAPSIKFALNAPIIFRFSIKVADLGAELVEISAASRIESDVSLADTTPEFPETTIYRGVFELAMIAEKCEFFSLVMMKYAQEQTNRPATPVVLTDREKLLI